MVLVFGYMKHLRKVFTLKLRHECSDQRFESQCICMYIYIYTYLRRLPIELYSKMNPKMNAEPKPKPEINKATLEHSGLPPYQTPNS